MTASSAEEFGALERAESLAGRAYRAIREQIATAGLRPGERLTERGLAARLHVSPTPVREALRRLEQERLVERLSPRHLRVVEHSRETLQEIMYAEVVLRAAAARFATAKITTDALDRMTDVVTRLRAGVSTATPEEQLALAGRFDAELTAASDNDTLRSLIESVSIFGRAHRLGAVEAMRTTDPRVGLRRIEEHEEILDALRARDPDLVEKLVREHLTEAMTYLLARRP